jgi:hypothetical protein
MPKLRTDFTSRIHGPGYRYHDTTAAASTEDHQTYIARTAAFMAAFPDVQVSVETSSVAATA